MPVNVPRFATLVQGYRANPDAPATSDAERFVRSLLRAAHSSDRIDGRPRAMGLVLRHAAAGRAHVAPSDASVGRTAPRAPRAARADPGPGRQPWLWARCSARRPPTFANPMEEIERDLATITRFGRTPVPGSHLLALARALRQRELANLVLRARATTCERLAASDDGAPSSVDLREVLVLDRPATSLSLLLDWQAAATEWCHDLAEQSFGSSRRGAVAIESIRTTCAFPSTQLDDSELRDARRGVLAALARRSPDDAAEAAIAADLAACGVPATALQRLSDVAAQLAAEHAGLDLRTGDRRWLMANEHQVWLDGREGVLITLHRHNGTSARIRWARLSDISASPDARDHWHVGTLTAIPDVRQVLERPTCRPLLSSGPRPADRTMRIALAARVLESEGVLPRGTARSTLGPATARGQRHPLPEPPAPRALSTEPRSTPTRRRPNAGPHRPTSLT